MSRDKGIYTHPNQKRAGIALTWTSANGTRPWTAQRDRRVQELREALAKKPLSVDEVAAMFKVKPATAEKYLRLARGEE